MATIKVTDQLPTNSADAMREFDDRYLAVYGIAQPPGWADDIGDLIETASPDVTFPIGLLSTKYQEFSGENRAKTLQEKDIRVKVAEYDAGYEARLIDLTTNVFAYQKWQQIPARFLAAEQRHRNAQVAAMLEAGTVGNSAIDGVPFFNASHPANPAEGTDVFSNYQASTKDVVSLVNIEAEATIMMGVLDENGQKLGIQPDTILVPTGKFLALTNLLKQDIVASTAGTATVRNPFLGVFNVVHVPELTDVNDWYLVDSKALSQGLTPWGMLRYQPAASLGLRHWDEDSDFFKNTGKIKVSSHIWYGFALLFPHAIRLVKGA